LGLAEVMKFVTDVQHLRQMSILINFREVSAASKFKVKAAVVEIFYLQYLGCSLNYLRRISARNAFRRIQDVGLTEVCTV